MSDVFTIRCRENGPLVLPATCKIVDHQGNEFGFPRARRTSPCAGAVSRRINRFATGRTRRAGLRRVRLECPRADSGPRKSGDFRYIVFVRPM